MDEGFKQAALIGAIIVLWDLLKKLIWEKNQDLRRNTDATAENTLAIRGILDELKRLTRLPSDVNNLGLIVRELRTKVEFLEKKSDRDT